MTFTQEQVEWIVAEVIRRLGVIGATNDQPARVAGDERSSSPAIGVDLAIEGRLVTLRSIEGRLAGVKRLLVNSQAVITPAVRDELKQRKIEVVFSRPECLPH
jgi:hypothetical protein